MNYLPKSWVIYRIIFSRYSVISKKKIHWNKNNVQKASVCNRKTYFVSIFVTLKYKLFLVLDPSCGQLIYLHLLISK